MAKRESAATASQRQRKPTKKQIEAGKANMAKGRADRKKKTDAARAAGVPRAGERWAALLSGQITVADLDEEELAKMRVRGADGGFTGRRPALPSHIAAAMQAESLKRAVDLFREAAPKAVKGLIEIANDPDVKPADRIRAYQLVMERSLGKVPDTVRVEAADSWGSLIADAMGSPVDRDAMRLPDDIASD